MVPDVALVIPEVAWVVSVAVRVVPEAAWVVPEAVSVGIVRLWTKSHGVCVV
jgi:hypothetical protein